MPKLGDKRKRGVCSYCGADKFDVWSSWPVYHNDTEEGWRSDGHAEAPGPKYVLQLGSCVANLHKQLVDLNKKVENR